MARQVNVVPHTHWDREWYKPYPVFRMQLVELLDLLLPQLRSDNSYAHFQLDGQMAVVDDYLEIRPERRGDLVDLAAHGKLTMGPWYTLPDEFLVSGETHVRNLQLGMARAEAFGGAMPVGYLPDMFGHVAQMPQILRGFGFADAVVWRGVPSAVVTPAFDWESPDGSVVRAEYLSDGYSNGARLPQDGQELVSQVGAFVAAQGDLVGDPLLWMNGTDHQLPQAHLGRVVADANAQQDEYTFTVTSLPQHLTDVPRADLPRWSGELRSGARSNLLMGVASCRVDVKQAAAGAERWLERVAEPLAAIWQPSFAWPGPFFDAAWLDVIRNAAHDSICGCSADEVNDAVLHRYGEATRVAESIADRALVRALAESGQPAIAVNSTARARAFTATAVLPGEVSPPHSQQLSHRPARLRTQTVSRAAAVSVVLRAGLEDPKVSRVDLAEATDGSGDWIATVHADRQPKDIDPTVLREQLEALAAEDPEAAVHLEVQRVNASQEVLLRTAPIPGFGWRGLAPTPLGDHAVRPDGAGLTNGIIAIEADQTDGTFSVNGIAGFGRLVDDGDAGDTYNWSPPAGDQVVHHPSHVHVLVSEAGPVRGRIEITRRYTWPERVLDDHRVGEVEVAVKTVVEVHAGEDLVRVSIEFDNLARDHRLRVHLPLPEPAEHSVAECAFGTVRRGLDAEGGPNEIGLATYPSRRFVSAGGLTVAHDGLTEYELVDIRGDGGNRRARELAITVVRSVGILSQAPMTMRALPAGPHLPTPAAQMPGGHRVDLALHLGDRDPYAVADDAFTPVLTARMPGGGSGDPGAQGQALSVTGVEVTALRRRDDDRLELRVVNATDAGTVLRVEGGHGEVTDLRGRPTGQPFAEELEMAPWKIVTLALDDA